MFFEDQLFKSDYFARHTLFPFFLISQFKVVFRRPSIQKQLICIFWSCTLFLFGASFQLENRFLENNFFSETDTLRIA